MKDLKLEEFRPKKAHIFGIYSELFKNASLTKFRSAKLTIWTTHRRCLQFFPCFWQPLSHVDILLLLSVGKFGGISHSSLPQNCLSLLWTVPYQKKWYLCRLFEFPPFYIWYFSNFLFGIIYVKEADSSEILQEFWSEFQSSLSSPITKGTHIFIEFNSASSSNHFGYKISVVSTKISFQFEGISFIVIVVFVY